jgi:hypothetical protein
LGGRAVRIPLISPDYVSEVTLAISKPADVFRLLQEQPPARPSSISVDSALSDAVGRTEFGYVHKQLQIQTTSTRLSMVNIQSLHLPDYPGLAR